jgi:hypothetical protein
MFSNNNSSNSDIKNIVTVDACNHTNYIFKNDTFKSFPRLNYSKANFICSYVSNKDIISSSISLSGSISDEDTEDILEHKAYEELGLDQSSSYIISHLEATNEGEERKFHLFVSKTDTLDTKFSSIIDQSKYVDFITPAPLLFKALYKKEIIPGNDTHCFVYFSKNDAFVTLYRNGEYVYSKSIEYSLEQIYNKYCQIVGEKANEIDFYSVLESEGLKTTNNDYRQNLMKIFGDVFMTVNDIIIYAKRAFKLDGVDKVYIGSQKGAILGLTEYSQDYLGLSALELDFEYNINTNEKYTDQLHYLMLLSAFDYLEDESDVVNLTMYPRAPSFMNRAGGQFIIATTLASLVGLAYPLVYLLGSYMNDAKVYGLKSQDEKLSIESKKYKEILSLKKSKIKTLDDKKVKLDTKYMAKTKTLTAIYDKKVNYKLKSGIYHMIAEELEKFDVNVDMLSSQGNDLRLSLLSVEDRRFTEVIKHLSEKYFDQIKSIDIERIERSQENNYYKGLLKMELK